MGKAQSIQYYTPEVLVLLKKNLTPAGKYMDEPKITRYLRATPPNPTGAPVSVEPV